MKSITLIILIVLITASGFFSCRQQTQENLTIREGVLLVGMDISYPPMQYYAEDGRTPIGFDFDLAMAIGEKLGLEVQLIDTSWDVIFTGLNGGRYDTIISAVSITPARQENFYFSRPYVSNSIVMVALRDLPEAPQSPDELEGRTVAFQLGTTADTFSTELARSGIRHTQRRYESIINCFDELRLGRVDAVITDFLVAFHYVAPAGSPFEIVWQSYEADKFGIVVRRGNNALVQAINGALEELYANGTLYRISFGTFGRIGMVTSAWD